MDEDKKVHRNTEKHAKIKQVKYDFGEIDIDNNY
jgi:hypothetical protein